MKKNQPMGIWHAQWPTMNQDKWPYDFFYLMVNMNDDEYLYDG